MSTYKQHELSSTTTSSAINSADTSSTTTTTTTATTTNDRVEWSRATILGFIEDYRRQRVLWDPNTKGYHIKQTKYESLKILGQKYGTEIRSIRSKIKSLRSSFHREHGKVINGRRKGVHYQPMWFAYEAIRFILDGESSRSQQTNNNNGSIGGGGGGESGAEAEELEEKLFNNECTAEDATAVDSVAEELAEEGDEEAEEEQVPNDLTVGAAVLRRQQLKVENSNNNTTSSSSSSPKATTTMRASASSSTTTNACAADDNSNNNIVARIAAAAALAAAVAAGRGAASACSADEQLTAVTRSDDFYGDLQNYCNISADDVKTEIIESDTTEIPMVDIPRTSTPYLNSTNCYKLNENHQQTFNARKRKSQVSHMEGGLLSPSKQQHLQQHSNLHSRQRDHSPVAAPTSSSHSNHNNNNNHHNNKSTTSSTQADEYGVFGEYVAITIRKLKTSKAKIVVKHLINNLLYEAELGKYDHGMPSSKEPPQLYKM